MDCQKLASPAGGPGLLEGLTALLDDKLKESELRTKAHMDNVVKEAELRMKAYVDNAVKESEQRIRAELSNALSHAGYNTVARLSNAAARSDVPLMKLKKEAGDNAGNVPPSPPFPATTVALFNETTADHINELERFYGVQFQAAAAAAAEVDLPLRTSRSVDLQQRRQQLAAFLGVR